MAKVSGKVAIVTGGASGIGEAISRTLVEEGAKVLVCDIADEPGQTLVDQLGPSSRYQHHDVRSEEQWRSAIAAAEAAFGPVTVLVNNAGGGSVCPTELLPESEYRSSIELNQTSVFLGMKSVFDSMKRAGGGAIINISSVAGLIGSPAALAYTAAKFAVRGMTKVAALDYAPHNIRVNSIHPGVTATALVSGMGDDALAHLIAEVPLGRMGQPDEIAKMALLLASDDLLFATGAEFVVDGGQTCR